MRNDTLYFLHQKYFQHFFQILDFVITDEKQFRGIHCSIVVIVFGGSRNCSQSFIKMIYKKLDLPVLHSSYLNNYTENNIMIILRNWDDNLAY